MANTIAGVNLAKIADMSIAGLTDLFAPLNALTTDFSTDIASSGDSITTRTATAAAAVTCASGGRT